MKIIIKWSGKGSTVNSTLTTSSSTDLYEVIINNQEAIYKTRPSRSRGRISRNIIIVTGKREIFHFRIIDKKTKSNILKEEDTAVERVQGRETRRRNRLCTINVSSRSCVDNFIYVQSDGSTSTSQIKYTSQIEDVPEFSTTDLIEFDY